MSEFTLDDNGRVLLFNGKLMAGSYICPVDKKQITAFKAVMKLQAKVTELEGAFEKYCNHKHRR